MTNSDFILVDESRLGLMTMRLELRFEERGGQHFVILCGTEFKNTGRAGRTGKAFDWPIKDPANPLELIAMAECIERAGEPGAEVFDPRGGVGRFFDRLFAMHFVNEVKEVASCERDGLTHTLSARLMREKEGILVTLTYRIPGFSPIWFRVPLSSFRALRLYCAGLQTS